MQPFNKNVVARSWVDQFASYPTEGTATIIQMIYKKVDINAVILEGRQLIFLLLYKSWGIFQLTTSHPTSAEASAQTKWSEGLYRLCQYPQSFQTF